MDYTGDIKNRASISIIAHPGSHYPYSLKLQGIYFARLLISVGANIRIP